MYNLHILLIKQRIYIYIYKIKQINVITVSNVVLDSKWTFLGKNIISQLRKSMYFSWDKSPIVHWGTTQCLSRRVSHLPCHYKGKTKWDDINKRR